ncbi:MAG: heavy-metal-associated domain-containing protein [Prevotella sp.]
MKKTVIIGLMALLSMSAEAGTPGKQTVDTLVVTTTPQMHCAGCENRIKSKLKFVKGTRKIVTSVPDQTVTIVYDSRKAKPETYTEALHEIGYEARQVKH